MARTRFANGVGHSMPDENRHSGKRTLCQPSSGFLRMIARSEAGNVLPLVAVGTLVLAGLVGGGVDMARSYQAERRLQKTRPTFTLAPTSIQKSNKLRALHSRPPARISETPSMAPPAPLSLQLSWVCSASNPRN